MLALALWRTPHQAQAIASIAATADNPSPSPNGHCINEKCREVACQLKYAILERPTTYLKKRKTVDENLTRLSKTISHALRHKPADYGLTLDSEGWVPVPALLAA